MERTRLFGVLAASGLVVTVWFSPTLRAVRRDRALTWATAPAAHVALIAVPQEFAAAPSAQERRVCARLVERVTRLGAEVVVLAGRFPPGADADADRALVDAVRASGRVVVEARAYDALRGAAHATGVLAVQADADGVVRQAPPADPPHCAQLAAAVPGGALFHRIPRVPEVPLTAALLDGADDLMRKHVAGRAVVIHLSRREDRYAVAAGRALVSTGWLIAAWIELARTDGFD